MIAPGNYPRKPHEALADRRRRIAAGNTDPDRHAVRPELIRARDQVSAGHVARRHYKFNQRWPAAFPEVSWSCVWSTER